MTQEQTTYVGWHRLTPRHKWRCLVEGFVERVVWDRLREMVARKGGGDSCVLPEGRQPSGRIR